MFNLCKLGRHNHVQRLSPDRVRTIRQSLYHGPVAKRELPLPRQTLKNVDSFFQLVKYDPCQSLDIGQEFFAVGVRSAISLHIHPTHWSTYLKAKTCIRSYSHLPSEKARVAAEPQTAHIPIFESKLIKVIRIEPADDDRIKHLVAQAEKEAVFSKKDGPSESSIIRQALRLGMDELERRNSQKR